MTYRTKNQDTLHIGMWNAICDRCGRKFKNVDLKEEWNGLIVCRTCYEPRHPQDFLKGVPDDPSVAWTRSETNTGCGPGSVPGQAVPGCAIPGHSKNYVNPL